jgi:ketosteroid isomerase-like protein
MRKAVTIAALALTVGVGACATGAQEEGFTRADQDTIRQQAADMAAAFNAKEVDKVVAHYADNSVFMPPNVPRIRGQEPLRDFYNDLLGKGATRLDLQPEEISGHGPLAFETGSYSIIYDDGVSRDRGKYLLVLRNTAGRWRVEKTIWSSDLPAQGSPAN